MKAIQTAVLLADHDRLSADQAAEGSPEHQFPLMLLTTGPHSKEFVTGRVHFSPTNTTVLSGTDRVLMIPSMKRRPHVLICNEIFGANEDSR